MSEATNEQTSAIEGSGERTDLVALLNRHRFFLKHTLRDLTEEQAAMTPTVSALCLGGLIKHVSHVEFGWASFVTEGPSGPSALLANDYSTWEDRFKMTAGDTISSVLNAYDQVAARTNALVMSVANLDETHPLPDAPWFDKGAAWSARHAFIHIIAETSQHSGHADIIRETIDGAKTMG